MTNEQLLIYLYGIYPEGGLTITLIVLTLAAGIPIFISYIEKDDRFSQRSKENGTLLYQVYSKPYKLLVTATIVAMIIGYFIPNKKTFILITATPTIVDSLTSPNGKLNKLNKILDAGLDKAIEKLSEKETK